MCILELVVYLYSHIYPICVNFGCINIHVYKNIFVDCISCYLQIKICHVSNTLFLKNMYNLRFSSYIFLQIDDICNMHIMSLTQTILLYASFTLKKSYVYIYRNRSYKLLQIIFHTRCAHIKVEGALTVMLKACYIASFVWVWPLYNTIFHFLV